MDFGQKLGNQTSLEFIQCDHVLFGHIARMPDETDAKQILTAFSAGNWRRPLGRPCITWM